MRTWAERQASLARTRQILASTSSRERAVSAASAAGRPDIAQRLRLGAERAMNYTPIQPSYTFFRSFSGDPRERAQIEGLTLVRTSNETGFMGVYKDGGEESQSKPYQARLDRDDGTQQHLGSFATAEEAALAYARALGPEASLAAAKKETRRIRTLRLRFRKLRRHAFIVGKAASLLQTIYNEVTYRPGNQGQKRSREEFEAAAAAQHA